MSSRNKRLVLGAVFLYVLASFCFLDKYPPFYADEVYYVEPAVNFLSEGHFRNNLFKYIPGYEVTNAIAGRLFSTVDAMLFKLLGVNIISIRLQSFLLALLTLVLFYQILNLLFSEPALAFFSSALLACSHPFIFASHFGRPDMTVCFYVVLSLYLYLLAEKNETHFLYFLSGLAASLAIDIHIPGNIAVYILAGTVLGDQLPQRPIRWKTFFWIALGGVLGIFWWLFMHVILNWDVFFKQWNVFVGSQFPPVYNPWVLIKNEYPRWQGFFWMGAYHRNLLLLVLFMLGFCYAGSRWKERPFKVLCCAAFSSMLGLILSNPSKSQWYIICVFPVWMMMGTTFLYFFWKSPSSYKKGVSLSLSFALILLLALENAHRFKFRDSNYARYMAQVKTFIPPGSVVLASETYWLGLRGYANLLGMWVLVMKQNFEACGIALEPYRGNTEDFLKRTNVGYIIADRELIEFPSTHEVFQDFITRHCVLAGEVRDPFYGSSRFLARKSPEDLVTKIYRVSH